MKLRLITISIILRCWLLVDSTKRWIEFLHALTKRSLTGSIQMEFFLDEFVSSDMCTHLHASDKERCKLSLNSVFFEYWVTFATLCTWSKVSLRNYKTSTTILCPLTGVEKICLTLQTLKKSFKTSALPSRNDDSFVNELWTIYLFTHDHGFYFWRIISYDSHLFTFLKNCHGLIVLLIY